MMACDEPHVPYTAQLYLLVYFVSLWVKIIWLSKYFEKLRPPRALIVPGLARNIGSKIKKIPIIKVAKSINKSMDLIAS